MAEIHQSKTVHPIKQVEGKESLIRSLDDLLERYLQLLDQYRTLQQSLARLLSKVRINELNCTHSESAQGYLSLAQANFSNPNRARYGRDHYDDRMKALIRVYDARILAYRMWRMWNANSGAAYSVNQRHLSPL